MIGAGQRIGGRSNAGLGKSFAWVFDPPIWMKIGESGGTIERVRNGEGRAYSGLVEAAEEFGLGCVL
jgi:hypothetical protein